MLFIYHIMPSYISLLSSLQYQVRQTDCSTFELQPQNCFNHYIFYIYIYIYTLYTYSLYYFVTYLHIILLLPPPPLLPLLCAFTTFDDRLNTRDAWIVKIPVTGQCDSLCETKSVAFLFFIYYIQTLRYVLFSKHP